MTSKEQIDLVLDAAELHARKLLGQANDYETKYASLPIAEETMRDHYLPLRKAIDAMRDGTMYVVGLLDETEFMGQRPEQHGITVAGPFFNIGEATAVAQTQSTDPDEAVIVPVVAS